MKVNDISINHMGFGEYSVFWSGEFDGWMVSAVDDEIDEAVHPTLDDYPESLIDEVRKTWINEVEEMARAIDEDGEEYDRYTDTLRNPGV